jgi:N-methylhydantoinase A
LLVSMQQEALVVVRQGSFGVPVTETRTAYMRYVGQGHEIPVPLPSRLLTPDDVVTIRAAYDTEYAKFFDRPVPGSDVEIMSYAVVVSTVTDVPPAPLASVLNPKDALADRSQSVRDTTTGVVSAWAIHDRANLPPGARIAGPAIVTEDETSTLIGPDWTATVNSLGYIEMTRER